jgi:hypothetical protein
LESLFEFGEWEAGIDGEKSLLRIGGLEVEVLRAAAFADAISSQLVT